MQPYAMNGPGQGIGLLIGLAIAVAILLLRNRTPRPLRIEWLWVRPVIYVTFMALALTSSPPPLDALSLALLVLGALVGAAAGWQRGRFIKIEVHPETHALTTRVSPIGLLFILAIVVARFGLRAGIASAASLHISLVAAADAVVLLLGAMMVTQGMEIWLRARRLLAEARGRATTGILVGKS